MAASTACKASTKLSTGDDSAAGCAGAGGNPNAPKPGAYPFLRMFFPVHVYVHFTNTHNYPDRMMQIKRCLTEEQWFPFPVTCTPVLASRMETEIGLFDVYVVGGQRRYRLGIVTEELRVPSLVEVLDTVGWAALLRAEPESAAKNQLSGSIVSQQRGGADVQGIRLGDVNLDGQDLTYVCHQGL